MLGRILQILMVSSVLTMAALAAAADSARFQDNGNGTVSDGSTGLMWQKSDSFLESKKGVSWYEAQMYADRKNGEKMAGFSDWRLPTMKELHGIWDATLPGKSKDGERLGLPPGFTSGGSYYLWSGDERGLNNAWYFGLGNKEEYFNLKEYADLEQGARLVRNER